MAEVYKSMFLFITFSLDHYSRQSPTLLNNFIYIHSLLEIDFWS